MIGVAVQDILMIEWLAKVPFIKDEKNQLKLTLDTTINVESENKLFLVYNTLRYHYEEHPIDPILEATFLTKFLLELPGENIHDGKLDIPDQACISMISIGISHARAQFITQAKSVGLDECMLPLVNPTEIFNRIKSKLEQNSSESSD